MVKVLIAEEKDSLSVTMERLVGRYGLEILKASDGQAALRVFDEHEPDLCFLEVLLPVLDGFEVCRVIRRRAASRRVPIIMTSNIFTDRAMVEPEMRQAAADDFLSQPCRPEDLERLLSQHLRWGEPGAPASREASPPPAASVAMVDLDSGGRRGRRGKVLIVEDQEDLNYIYRGFVTSMGFEALGAFDGEQAVAIFERERPDICLVDLLLPGNNGFEVCRRVRALERSPQTSLIVMSAVYRNVDQLEQDLQRFRVDDFIHKPFSMDALHELLLQHQPQRDAQAEHSGLRSSPSDLRLSIRHHLHVKLDEAGDLAESDFTALLFRIYADAVSGRLTLRRGDIMRELHFLRGMPVHAFSNSVEDALGTLVARRGLVEAEIIQELLTHPNPSRRLGEELLGRGLITPGELDLVLRDQVKQRVMACFGITEGAYLFEFGAEVVEPQDGVELNPLALIREGVARFTSTNRLAELMQSYVHRYVIPTAFFTRFFASLPSFDAERRLMASIDGRRTLSELLQLRFLEISPALELVWSLYQARMVIFSEVPGDTLSRPVRSLGANTSARASQATSREADEGTSTNVSIWGQIFGD